MDKFPFGELLVSKCISEKMDSDNGFAFFVLTSLERYQKCDWGSVSDEDKAQNDHAVDHDERIMGQYDCAGQPRIWIITEWDRSVTTILFPDEY